MDSQVHQNADGFEAALTTESPWTDGSEEHAFTAIEGDLVSDAGEHVAFSGQWAPFVEVDAPADGTEMTEDAQSYANGGVPAYVPETDAAYDDAAHNDAAHNDAAHNDAAHNEAAHNDAAHNDAAHNDAAHKEAAYNEAAYNEAAFETFSESASYEGATDVFAHAVPASQSDFVEQFEEDDQVAYAEPVAFEQAHFVEQGALIADTAEGIAVESGAYSEEYEGEYLEDAAGYSQQYDEQYEQYDEDQPNLVPFASYEAESNLGRTLNGDAMAFTEVDASGFEAQNWAQTDDFEPESLLAPLRSAELHPERASADAALAALTAAVAGTPIAASAKEQKKSAKDEAKAAKAAEKAAKTSAKSEAKTAKLKNGDASSAVDADAKAVAKDDKAAKAASKAAAKVSKKAAKDSNVEAVTAGEATAKPKARLAVIGAALVALIGGGAYVATSGGGQAAVPVVTTPITTAAVTPVAPATEGAAPTELALSDPAASDDELGFEEPIQAIEIEEPVAALPLDEPAAPATTAPATTVPATTTSIAAVVPVAVPSGQLSRGACVQIDGVRDARTRRIPNATITTIDCTVAHNAEIVEKTSSACEPLVVSYTGYDKSGAQALAGSGADFSVVQNAADGAIFCVAGFEGMPQYTGQLAGAMVPA